MKTIKKISVKNMVSDRSQKEVANQFEIHTPDGVYFQSYQSVIAFVPNCNGQIVLDADKWDYSVTTGKYRNQFLGETKKETEKKIKSGEYVLANLN